MRASVPYLASASQGQTSRRRHASERRRGPLRFLAERLAEALRDILRVAESRRRRQP